MIQIAICDDEQNSRAYLKQLILKQSILEEDLQDYEIVEFTSGTELLNASKEVDILFLDVDLKEEFTGIELARVLRKHNKETQPIVIFISGYKEYVFDAFDVDAFHYLLKPIDSEKFTKVFEKAYQHRKSFIEQEIKNIHIQSGTLNKVMPIDELFFIESQNHKVLLHTKQGVFEYYAKISDLEMQLEGEFFRIHKRYLLNLAYLYKIFIQIVLFVILWKILYPMEIRRSIRWILEKRDYGKLLFLNSLFWNFQALSFLISNSGYQMIEAKLMHGFEVQSIEDMLFVYKNMAIGMVGMFLMYTICFLMMLFGIKKLALFPKMSSFKITECFFLSVLNIVGWMFAQMIGKSADKNIKTTFGRCRRILY